MMDFTKSINTSKLTRRIFTGIFIASIVGGVIGCGGGGESGGGTSGGTSLSGSYDKITQGMAYATVQGIVGVAPYSSTVSSVGISAYTWVVNNGTPAVETLTVQLKANGVVYKNWNNVKGDSKEQRY